MRPSELVGTLEAHGLQAADLAGIVYDPRGDRFGVSRKDLGVNYMLAARRAR